MLWAEHLPNLLFGSCSCLSSQNFFRPEYDPSANTCICESASVEYLELTVSCFSITRWEDKETQTFDLDSSVMNH